MAPPEYPGLNLEDNYNWKKGRLDMENIDRQLLDKIDGLQLSPRAARLKEESFGKPGIAGERARLAVEAWKETEGEPVDLRYAKVLKKVLEEMPVVIFRGQMLVGNETKYFRGTNPHVDHDSSFLIPLLKEKPGTLTLGGPVERGIVSQEDYAILIDAIDYFKGKTMSDRTRKVSNDIFGSWYSDLVAAGTLNSNTSNQPGQTYNNEKLVNEGLGSIIAEIERRMREFAETEDDDIEKINFWQAAIIALKATIALGKRYSKLASDMAAEEKDPAWRAELEEIAEVFRRVPEHPARTFREALQSIVLIRLAMKMQTGNVVPQSVGLLDQYLYPYFKRDLEEGRLSLEKAAELVSDLFLHLNLSERVMDIVRREHKQKGPNSSIGLGGPNRQGEDASNELTYLILHVMGLIKYVEPHLVIRWHSATPAWLMRKALETNLRAGGGVPQFQNSEHIIRLMTEQGIPLENARYFQTTGCARVEPWDRTATLTQTFTNVPLCIDLALHDGTASKTGKQIGVQTGDPRQFTTYDEFYNAFKKQYEYVVRKQLRHDRCIDRVLVAGHRAPLTSALKSGCLEKGRDFFAGGHFHYDWWLVRDRGFIPTADSLMAVKKLVYDDRKISMGELLEALDSNFKGEGGESIRQLCLAAPKFGNDVDEVDLIARDVARFSAEVIRSEKNIFGEHYCLNRNGSAWHYMAGSRLAALPNGRKAGEALADGSLSPMQGMDRHGPTALLNSVLKADHRESSASVLNVKFSAALLGSVELRDKVAGLTENFMKKGGNYIQYNILDAAALKDAKRHPEKHRDLIVRVGGYSAYFVNLSSEVQDELIERTEHSLAGI